VVTVPALRGSDVAACLIDEDEAARIERNRFDEVAGSDHTVGDMVSPFVEAAPKIVQKACPEIIATPVNARHQPTTRTRSRARTDMSPL